MNLRERIADWISGGELSALISDMESLREALSVEVTESEEWASACYSASKDSWRYQDLLNRIAACETPNANATVKRMARIAREGMV